MAAAIQVLHRVHGLHRDSSGSAPSAPTLTGRTSNDAAGFASCCGPSSCSPKRAFDTGLRPGPFPTRAASLLPGLLTATRTGLTPASDDEHEQQDHPLVTRPPPVPLGAPEIEVRRRAGSLTTPASGTVVRSCRRRCAGPARGAGSQRGSSSYRCQRSLLIRWARTSRSGPSSRAVGRSGSPGATRGPRPGSRS